MNEEIPYLDRLRSELVRGVAAHESREAAQDRSRSRAGWAPAHRLALAGAAAALVVGAVVVGVSLWGGDEDPRGLGRQGPGVAGSGPAAAGDCVAAFGIDTLRTRDVAFDGTIVEVRAGESHVTEDEAGGSATEVTFEVHRWYTGGNGSTINLLTYESPGVVTSAGGPPLEVGTRLLASGDGGFLWSCGFSMPYSEQGAELFERAFQEG